MMFFDFDEIYDVLVEQYVGNQIVSRQSFSAPKEVIVMQFLALCEQAAQEPQPRKVKMSRLQNVCDEITGEERTLALCVEFRNNRWEE